MRRICREPNPPLKARESNPIHRSAAIDGYTMLRKYRRVATRSIFLWPITYYGTTFCERSTVSSIVISHLSSTNLTFYKCLRNLWTSYFFFLIFEELKEIEKKILFARFVRKWQFFYFNKKYLYFSIFVSINYYFDSHDSLNRNMLSIPIRHPCRHIRLLIN